jgi:manganese transport protein
VEKAQITSSLPEVHSSVATARATPWKRLLAFAGPAYLVSVGYMDPGNWATDLEGGARFGYQLLWVLVLSNAMAILLQTLSARLGIVAQLDLAQACRLRYPSWISGPLWVLCEIAIAACDLAEILGAAIALKLLFGLPLLAGIGLTALDTLLLLWLSRYGIRLLEAIVLGLVAVIAACFLAELWLAKPVWTDVARGLVPQLTPSSLYVAIGILGATVMPHNLYLHSALVQTRRIGATEAEKREACRFNLIDSVVALNGALLVNGAILVVAATVFFRRGIEVTRMEQAHLLLSPLLGAGAASVLFAVALLCAGQSSTITGTLAGQIVMEGFLSIRMQPWLRRLFTRLAAIVPAVAVIYVLGETATYSLLILTQVILSLQLPFAVIPLVRFTSDPELMGSFANRAWVRTLSWIAAAVIVGLNGWLVLSFLASLPWAPGMLALALVLAAVAALLAYVTLEPWLPAAWRRKPVSTAGFEAPVIAPAESSYRRILVPLDHSARDADAVAHALAFARSHQSVIHLLHVEEGVTSLVYGESSTAEVEMGARYFREIQQSIQKQGVTAELSVRHASTPREAIIRYAREIQADLVVMGAHGHQGWKDLIFGTTINAVRHAVEAPVLIVGRHPPKG